MTDGERAGVATEDLGLPILAGPTDLGLLSLILAQIDKTERRILVRLDDNSSTGRKRWERHEAEHADQATAIAKLREQVDGHLDDEAAAERLLEARLGPIRKSIGWVWREWRTIAIIGMVVVDMLARWT